MVPACAQVAELLRWHGEVAIGFITQARPAASPMHRPTALHETGCDLCTVASIAHDMSTKLLC